MLALLHLLLWHQTGRAPAYLLSVLTACSAGGGAHLAVIGVDPRSCISDANPLLESLTGYSAGELAGTPIRELVAPGDRAELDARLAAAAQTGPRPAAAGTWSADRASGGRWSGPRSA